MATSPNLEDMKLPELKELAKQMGLRGTSTMRKPELIATLQAARSGGEAPAGVTVRAPKSAASAASADPAAQVATPSADAEVAAGRAENAGKPAEVAEVKADDAEDSEKSVSKTSRRTRVERTERSERFSRRKQAEAPASEDAVGVMVAVNALDSLDETPKRRRRRDTEAAADLLAELGLDDASPKQDDRRRHRKDDEADAEPRRRRRAVEELKDEDVVRDLDDILATLPSQGNEGDERHDEAEDGDFTRRGRGRAGDRGGDRMDRRGRRLRGRDRDYDERDDRRGRNSERNDRTERNDRVERNDRTDRNVERVEREQRHEESKEDLVPVAGIVDVLDSYAFVRTSGYLPGPNDVYVSMGQVKKYGLRKGDAVHGSIRTPREGDRRNQRQKFVPLQSIDSINGMTVEAAQNRPQFNKLTPLYPQERLKQETAPNKLTGRLIDIVAPIGKGQRGLIVSPPKAGKTITLQNIA